MRHCVATCAGAILLVGFVVMGWRRYRGYRQLPLSSRPPRAGTNSVSGGSVSGGSVASSPGQAEAVGGSTASFDGADGVEMVGVEQAGHTTSAIGSSGSALDASEVRVAQAHSTAGVGVGIGVGVGVGVDGRKGAVV